MTKSEELREQRAKLIVEARGVLEKAETDNREPTAEERQHFDKIMGSKNDKGEPVLGEAEKLFDRIERIEKIEKEERDLAARLGRQSEPDKPGEKPKPGSTEKRSVIWEMRKGRPTEQRIEIAPDTPIWRTAQPEYRKAFNGYLRTGVGSPALEQRALQADVDDSGGFLLLPQQMAAGIIKAVDDQVFMRQFAHIETLTSADSLGAVSLDADPDDSDWTGELTAPTADSTMDFGKRELNPQLSTKRLLVSMKLLRKSADVEGLVRDRLGYKFAITEEKGFLTGSTSLEPLGVFTASDHGISTGRDVSTGNTTTTIGADNLREVKYNQKAAYWARLRWIFHRDAVKMISKLKDGEGRYIWQEGITVGDPDRILGFPVHMSEYAPSTFTTGLYVGILGDFDKYWIAQSLSFTLQRLVELYAGTNQIGFIGRMEVDGMPVLEEAFSRVTLA